MKLTIIRADGAVYKDGVSYSDLDLATVPADVHALQFNDASSVGWIEFVQDDFGAKAANEMITSLPSWATTAMTKWDDAKSAEQAAIAAAAEQARIAAEQATANATTTTQS
jgi:hypothetical protein